MAKKNNYLLTKLLTATLFLMSVSTKAQTALPNLSLSDVENIEYNLSDFAEKGKSSVIIFWATWCKPCIDELDNIADYYAEWKETVDFNLVTVCIDDSRTSSSVKSFTNGRDWPFLVLIDINQDLKRAMNVTEIPHYYIFDKEGVLVKRHTGYLPGDEEQILDELQNIGYEN